MISSALGNVLGNGFIVCMSTAGRGCWTASQRLVGDAERTTTCGTLIIFPSRGGHPRAFRFLVQGGPELDVGPFFRIQSNPWMDPIRVQLWGGTATM